MLLIPLALTEPVVPTVKTEDVGEVLFHLLTFVCSADVVLSSSHLVFPIIE